MEPSPNPYKHFVYLREGALQLSNIRLKPRLCDCGRTAMMYIVRTNENGNQGHEDDNDTSSTIRSSVGPQKAIRIEELNDRRTRIFEMDNEIHEHGRRLQRMRRISSQ
ncbi:hypothetical protein CsSME_00041370 [Camellia sinensis var. sinensis]